MIIKCALPLNFTDDNYDIEKYILKHKPLNKCPKCGGDWLSYSIPCALDLDLGDDKIKSAIVFADQPPSVFCNHCEDLVA